MGWFFDRFSKESLNKMYDLLADVTPLAYDCGALCEKACCKGSETDGMVLFPGERAFFEGAAGFRIAHNDPYDYDYLVCGGSCERDLRPLSCRIFPYFFYLAQNGEITVAPDIRALGRCPLAEGNLLLQRTFLRRMRMCAKVIRSDAELYDFIARMSAMITDFGRLA